ncbi:hypothetical protein BU17DRAFT_63677 [Hysterangium stoloniferum]|nr:hypothetical protein BU17DRAFT_63677 [Hysterangium stoloniferum]
MVVLESVYHRHHLQNVTVLEGFSYSLATQISSDGTMLGRSAAAALTLVFFDYFLTLDAEMTYVWSVYARSPHLFVSIMVLVFYVYDILCQYYSHSSMRGKSYTEYYAWMLAVVICPPYHHNNDTFYGLMQERSRFQGHATFRDRIPSGFSLIIRSSITFYLACSGIVLINGAFILGFSHRVLQSVAFPWLVAVYTITGSRLVTVLGGDIQNSPGVHIYKTENRSGIETMNEYELRPQQDVLAIPNQETTEKRGPSFFTLE